MKKDNEKEENCKSALKKETENEMGKTSIRWDNYTGEGVIPWSGR